MTSSTAARRKVKMPLLVFLLPAVLPLVLIGDPTTLLMAWMN